MFTALRSNWMTGFDNDHQPFVFGIDNSGIMRCHLGSTGSDHVLLHAGHTAKHVGLDIASVGTDQMHTGQCVSASNLYRYMFVCDSRMPMFAAKNPAEPRVLNCRG